MKCSWQINNDFIVCDAGGSTVDTTLYTVNEITPLIRLREKRASACEPFLAAIFLPSFLTSFLFLLSLGVQAGAIFVNQSAEDHFKQAFTNVGLDAETVKEYVAIAIESFEVDAKRTFKNTTDSKVISVGGRRFTNADLNVRRGSMTMLG